jgi:hypothetical protein
MLVQWQTPAPMVMQQHGGRVKYADRYEPRDDRQERESVKPIADDQSLPPQAEQHSE